MKRVRYSRTLIICTRYYRVVDLSTLAFLLIFGNLLHGGFLAVFSIRDLIRKGDEYGQKFYGLTYLIKGIALILISIFLYYQLANGLKAEYIVYAMILAPLLSSYKGIWNLGKSLYRGLVESRADILVQLNNERWEQIEARKSEYASTITDKDPEYVGETIRKRADHSTGRRLCREIPLVYEGIPRNGRLFTLIGAQRKSLISGCCCVLFHLVLEVFPEFKTAPCTECNRIGHKSIHMRSNCI